MLFEGAVDPMMAPVLAVPSNFRKVRRWQMLEVRHAERTTVLSDKRCDQIEERRSSVWVIALHYLRQCCTRKPLHEIDLRTKIGTIDGPDSVALEWSSNVLRSREKHRIVGEQVLR